MPIRLGLGVAAGLDPSPLAHVAAGLEELGYESAWTNDTPSGDGLAMLRAWADQSQEITLAVGALALDRHSPASIAGRVRELELPLDRLVLGLGAGFSEHPVGAVRSGVKELRGVLPGVRVAVAAMGPGMCRLGGEVGDDVLLNWMTPERAVWAERLVREGAKNAGRDPAEVVVYGHVRTAIGDDAAEKLAREAAFYMQLPHYARHFESMGGDPATVGIAAHDAADLRRQLAEYGALDIPVVRALTEGDSEAVLALARVAAGEES